MIIELIWYFIMAMVYLAIGAYITYMYMEPAWRHGFNDGWHSGMACGGDYTHWYMCGWSQGWDDCQEKMNYMEHFDRGFKSGWEASDEITDKINT